MSNDATASVIQIMAALSGCKITAKACNMINTGKRDDVYTTIADRMNRLLEQEFRVSRKQVKKPCMTSFYNSVANPKSMFNKQQLKVFYETLESSLPGALDVMDAINEFWDYSADVHQWTLPDGHIARVPVTEMSDIRIEIDELNHRTFTYRYSKQQPSENYRKSARRARNSTFLFQISILSRINVHKSEEISILLNFHFIGNRLYPLSRHGGKRVACSSSWRQE